MYIYKATFIFIALLCVFGGIVFPRGAWAATFFAEATPNSIGLGHTVAVAVYLNAEGDLINTVGGRLDFPVGYIRAVDVSDAGSIVSAWVERPMSDEKGALSFSGIIPGGYSGSQGLLFTVFLVPVRVGTMEAKFSELAGYMADGLGTPVSLKAESITFNISDKVPEAYAEKVDVDKPEDFPVERSNYRDAFQGKWFIAFNTQDKGSGVDHFEVAESSKQNVPLTWKQAASPHILEDQSLRSHVFVKAVDRAGNERVVSISPNPKGFFYPGTWLWSILIVLTLGIGVSIILKRKQ